MKYLKIKSWVYATVFITIIGIVGVYNVIFASANDPDLDWLAESSQDGYRIVIPLGMESRIIGGPFARGFMKWDPRDIERKLTITPKNGVPEVTSPGFDVEENSVLIFYDSDTIKKYGSRPYYAVAVYGGESLELKEIDEQYAREIGRTGVYIARVPMKYNIQHLRIHKVYVQGPPPEKTYEINWNNKVEVKFMPDCDC